MFECAYRYKIKNNYLNNSCHNMV